MHNVYMYSACAHGTGSPLGLEFIFIAFYFGNNSAHNVIRRYFFLSILVPPPVWFHVVLKLTTEWKRNNERCTCKIRTRSLKSPSAWFLTSSVTRMWSTQLSHYRTKNFLWPSRSSWCILLEIRFAHEFECEMCVVAMISVMVPSHTAAASQVIMNTRRSKSLQTIKILVYDQNPCIRSKSLHMVSSSTTHACCHASATSGVMCTMSDANGLHDHRVCFFNW